jgi:hypothetical protein
MPKKMRDFCHKKNNITQTKFIKNQLYLFSCFIYAIVYGLSRYQALTEAEESLSLSSSIGVSLLNIASASASGVSLFSVLSVGEEEEEEEKKEEKNQSNLSLKYNALQRGEDIMYEIGCIGTSLLLSLLSFSPSRRHGSTKCEPTSPR